MNKKLESLSFFQKNPCFQLLCIFNLHSHVPTNTAIQQHLPTSRSPNGLHFPMFFPQYSLYVASMQLISTEKSYFSFFWAQPNPIRGLWPESHSPDTHLHSFSTEESLVDRDISMCTSVYSLSPQRAESRSLTALR